MTATAEVTAEAFVDVVIEVMEGLGGVAEIKVVRPAPQVRVEFLDQRGDRDQAAAGRRQFAQVRPLTEADVASIATFSQTYVGLKAEYLRADQDGY